MDKIDFIKDFASQLNRWQSDALIPALVHCLSGEDASHALGTMVIDDAKIRHALLRKVGKDIESVGFQPCHRTLIQSLTSAFNSLPSNRKQTYGYYLHFLYDYAPSDLQTQIVQFFVSSRYAALRNRGYNILRRHWNNKYKSSVIQAWEKHRKYQCALLIVEHFPDSILIRKFDALQETLKGQSGAAKLFIRVGTKKPDVLQHLEEADPITFTYVMVKLGKSLRPKQAWKIFEQYKFDNRIGLFIWCLGQMGLWQVLQDIASRSTQLREEEFALHQKKYGILTRPKS